MTNPEHEPKPSNPYEALESPMALIGHIMAEDSAVISWRAVAERAVEMEGQDGAGALAVMAFDRHLRASEATQTYEGPNIDHNHLEEVATRMEMAVRRGDDVADSIGAAGRRFEQTADETMGRLGAILGRLETMTEPYGALGRLGEVTSRLEQTLSYHQVERLSEAAQTLNIAAARIDNGHYR